MMGKFIKFTSPSPLSITLTDANIASTHLDVNLLSIQLVDISTIIFNAPETCAHVDELNTETKKNKKTQDFMCAYPHSTQNIHFVCFIRYLLKFEFN